MNYVETNQLYTKGVKTSLSNESVGLSDTLEQTLSEHIDHGRIESVQEDMSSLGRELTLYEIRKLMAIFNESVAV